MYLTVFTSIPVTWFSLLINSMYPFQSQNQIQTIKDKQFIINCLEQASWLKNEYRKLMERDKLFEITTFLFRCVFISYGDFMIFTIFETLGTRKKLLDYTWVIHLHTFIYITFSFEPCRLLERGDSSRVLSSFPVVPTIPICSLLYVMNHLGPLWFKS